MKIISQEGKEQEFNQGALVKEVLLAMHPKDQLKGVLGIKINDQLLDWQSPVTMPGKFKLVTLAEDSEDSKLFYRHSFSHIMAQAVKRLYPNTKLGVGPAISTGFYYDMDLESHLSVDDLEKVSLEMQKIIKEDHKFERQEVTEAEARKILKELNDPYKQELFDQISGRGETITFYKDGEYLDLCRGPHVSSTGMVKHFKLLELAGAYWRGDEKRKMLQRIYGTAFLKKEDLENYLWQIEEAKKRDHRKLGKELDLFSTNPDTVGAGLILWHPKGGLVRHLIEEHCKEKHIKGGYDFVYTPHIGKGTLWETSGHLGFYKDSMYAPIVIDEQEYYLKPMNCPFHTQIYSSSVRSYRDLPLRFAEWGTVYRFEKSGVLHGLARVRGFTQDDAHLFCRFDQMPAEIDKVLSFSLNLLKSFGFTEFKPYLSTRPAERVGEDQLWDASEEALLSSLKRSGLEFGIKEGDGAFYGPKIDLHLQDALNRSWQLSTIQFDFNMPERFNLSYIGEDGKEHRPFMIHRALLGSIERFFAILIEHYAGAFPFWLAPVQVVVLPVSEKYEDYAEEVLRKLLAADLRAETDSSSNTLNYRIRNSQNMKIPYMLVVGERERENKTVSVRLRTEVDQGAKNLAELIELLKTKRDNKENTL